MKFLLCLLFPAATSAVLAVDPPPVQDFATPDVNSSSLRRAVTQANLSPRNYLNQVSAWYFGWET